MSAHLHVVGARARDRRPFLERPGTPAVFASCHQGLRGPYTGVDTVLAAILPDAARRWPGLVDYHRMEILEAIPELTELIGPAPRTLAKDAPFVERTRWYGKTMTRSFSQGIITFLREYAHRLRQAAPNPAAGARRRPPRRDHHPGVRRLAAAPPGRRPVAGDRRHRRRQPAGAALAVALADHTDWEYAPATPEPGPRTPAELAAEYIQLDGTCDDPAVHEAYLALDPEDRAALHDKRADELDAGAGWGVRVAALVFHRERGTDPHGLGLAAVEDAAEYLTVMGFQHAAADMCERGRALTDPDKERPTASSPTSSSPRPWAWAASTNRPSCAARCGAATRTPPPT
ncbi:hypothetical protein ACFQ9X_15565 [Catenulispora yoronensis]